MKRFLKINEVDNVAVAIADDLKKGEVITLDGRPITLHEDIQSGHKFAIKEIAEGEEIIKYGYPIGLAIHAIKAGEWVHSHNIKTGLNDDLAYSYHPKIQHSNYQKNDELRVMGYLRKNGDMGIRNELWIVPSVGCVNGQAQAIVERIKSECDCSHLDDVRTYTHNYGCSQLGEDHANTQKALAALIKHPNAGGVLVLGLGCENNQIASLKEVMGEWDDSRIKFLIAQEVEDEVETGFQICRELVENCRNDKREPLPLNLLRVGLKCGGSDGFSGITANPLVGLFSDWLITQGGTTLLTEVPEMFGAEKILMNRCRNEELFDKTVHLINDFKQYFMRYGEKVDENPSPGNKAGGITTLEDKSLGCTQKGGTSPVEDVLKYAEPVKKHGLSLLNAPGNDLVASNALVVSGAHVVLFTTGRGTPFGCPVPTVKVSSNTPLYEKKKNWIDFNAGALLDGVSMDKLTDEFYEYLLKLASGEVHAKSEMLDKHELAIFKDGVTL